MAKSLLMKTSFAVSILSSWQQIHLACEIIKVAIACKLSAVDCEALLY